MRPYLGPWLVALLLIFMAGVWSILEWGQIQTSQTERAKRFGEMFSVLVDASLHAQPHTDPFVEPGLARHVLLDLAVETPSIMGASISLDGRPIASMATGTPQTTSEPAGDALQFDYPLRRTAAQPLKMPARLSTQGGAPQSDEVRSLEGGPVLSLVLSVSPPLSTNRGQAMLWKVAMALAGIVSFCIAWALRIRQRRDAEDLAVERSRRSHLEELSVAAAGLAHETKNPLGIILGIAQRIRDAPSTDDTTRRLSEQIIDAADRAAERLGEFLNFARIHEPTLSSVAAKDVIGSVVEVLSYDFELAKVALRVECAPLTIQCDPSMLKQILVNLLLNSLEACDEGAAVTVRLQPQGAKAVLVVEDQGRGIPPDLRTEVFKPYVTGRADGHGLGLAIVSRIVERHGWTVSLESEPGRGTRIIIEGITQNPSQGAPPHDQTRPDRG